MQMGMHGLRQSVQHYTHLNICEFPTIRHSVNRKTCIVNIHSTENYTCGASNHYNSYTKKVFRVNFRTIFPV